MHPENLVEILNPLRTFFPTAHTVNFIVEVQLLDEKFLSLSLCIRNE